jgi:hypothetical protein
MSIDRPDCDAAAAEASPSEGQAALGGARAESSFCFESVTAYLGALIILCTMGLFGFVSWQSFDGLGILALSLSYALCFALAGHLLWFQAGLKVQGGLLVTLAVCMTPLAIYSLEKACGWQVDGGFGQARTGLAWLKQSGFFVQTGTILAALVAIRWFRFPLLAAPIAFALWLMGQEVASYGQLTGAPLLNELTGISMSVGLGLLVVGLVVDRRAKEDFAFWLYLVGLLALELPLPLRQGDSELRRALYCLLALALLGIGTLLRRRTFLVFGAVGVVGYLSHLSGLFGKSLVFPLITSLVGGLMLFLGVQLHQRRVPQRLLPLSVRRLLPPRRQ